MPARSGNPRDCGLGPQAASGSQRLKSKAPRCVITAPSPGSVHAPKCSPEEPANQARGMWHAMRFIVCKLCLSKKGRQKKKIL